MVLFVVDNNTAAVDVNVDVVAVFIVVVFQ